jgi:hypothetical protein
VAPQSGAKDKFLCPVFFSTYEYLQQASVLIYTSLEKHASDKQSHLLGPFLTYKEN